MKKLILVVSAGALVAVGLGFARVLPATSMVAHVLVAATMILALLSIVDASDRPR